MIKTQGHNLLSNLKSRALLALVLSLLLTPKLLAQGDIIVQELSGVKNYAQLGTKDAFSFGTTCCNIGQNNVKWLANTNEHPVIGQNLYRYKDGAFEQIGQGWLKHGVYALSLSLCSICVNGSPTGEYLGPGCSDPYLANLNGSQSGLGPKSEVNATTGLFPYPYGAMGQMGDSVYKRLQVEMSAIDPALNANARYFVEGQYVTQEDAAAGTDMNNASYREVSFAPDGNGGFDVAFATSQTVVGSPAILAWPTLSPDVQIESHDVVNDGRFWIAHRSDDLGSGQRRHFYSIFNLNSDRSAQAFRVAMTAGATVSNLSFNDVDYHSGEPFDGSDWTASYSTSMAEISWSTATFATNSNANALRWGTMYSFAFDCVGSPTGITVDLFKPKIQSSDPTSLSSTLGAPDFTLDFATPLPTALVPSLPQEIRLQTKTIQSAPDPSKAKIYVRNAGPNFVAQILSDLGGGVFAATLPALPCYASLSFYIEIESLAGQVLLLGDATKPFDLVADQSLALVASDDFETDQGWMIVNTPGLMAGAWERGFPLGLGNRGDPAQDADGSGQCFLTGNAPGDSDLEGSSTTLISPVFDLGLYPEARVHYSYWFNDLLSAIRDDRMEIDVSNNAGTSWVRLETVTFGSPSWRQRSYRIGDFLPPTATVQFRFRVGDILAPSIVEAGVDAFSISTCPLLIEQIARGNAGGVAAAEQLLQANGSFGGPLRHVSVPVSAPLSFSMAQVSTSAAPMNFAIFGFVGIPSAQDIWSLPAGIGPMNFVPCYANPADSRLFVLTDTLGSAGGSCARVLPGTPAPWFYSYSLGIPFSTEFTLQAVVIDPAGPINFSTSNAIIYRVGP